MIMRAFDEQSSVRGNFPAWLAEYREQQRTAFMQYGIPTKTNERWKYTDLTALAKQPFTAPVAGANVTQETVDQYRLHATDAVLLVFVDGYFVPALSDLHKLPAGVIACSMLTALTEHEDLVKEFLQRDTCAQNYPFAALNSAIFADGLFLYVQDSVNLNLPLHILSLSTGQEMVMINPNHLFVFGNASETTLLHEYASLVDNLYFHNIVTNIVAKRHAKVSLTKLQHESTQAVHMENFFVDQGQDSDVSISHVTTGAQFSRDDTKIMLAEMGSVCRTSGFYHTSRDGQYIDHHVVVNHYAPRTNSEMTYKGIVDKKSRAVFNGGLYVKPDAQKINAFQENHNLLLSGSAEVYSKPELEIYADDVKCRHGATTGQIDQDALFYMRARGIDHTTAMNILLKGFADDVLQRITHPALQQHARKQVIF
jgi:Fe-S cluster assembly protein SufD